MMQLARQGSCGAALAGTTTVTAMIAGAGGALLGAIVFVSMLVVLACSKQFRAIVHDADRRRDHRARRRRRKQALSGAGVPWFTLHHMTELANDVERTSPEEAALFDLEGLLDTYVALECEHERLEHALAMTELGTLTRALQQFPDGAPTARRTLLERRLQLWAEGRRRADAIAETIATTTELVRLIAQRAELGASGDIDAACIEAGLERLAADDVITAELAEPRR